MTRVIGIIQARMTSTRLPGKILKLIHNKTFLELIIRRLQRSNILTDIVLAVPENNSSDPLVRFATKLDFNIVFGSENNLINRYFKAANMYDADYIVRVTSDCPFVDPILIDEMANMIFRSDLDFVTNVCPPTWPDGLDITIFSRETLNKTKKYAKLDSEREHVVPWMWNNSNLKEKKRLKGYNFTAPSNLSNYRWTLDDKLDLEFFKSVSKKLSWQELVKMSWKEFILFFKDKNDITMINSYTQRDQGYLKSLSED